jgi:hypothetical protein
MLLALLEGKNIPLHRRVLDSEAACQKARIELHAKMSPPEKPVALYTKCIRPRRIVVE